MFTSDVDALFKPTSASIRQLLSDLVGGFSIPLYQRPYRWTDSDQRRLFDDIISGLERLVNDPSAVSFVGAVITVTDVSDHHQLKPADARQIIDGQQRLTTILMIAVGAHELLANSLKAVEASADNLAKDWLLDQVAEIQANLVSCLGQKKNYGTPGFKTLPKIVRDMADVWSVNAEKARYISPIAVLLHSYAEHEIGSPFKLIPPKFTVHPEAVGSSPEDFKVFAKRFQNVCKLVKDVSLGRDGDLAESIDLETIFTADSCVLKSLFQGVSSELLGALTLLVNDEKVAQCVRLLLFSQFMLERVALTQINAKDDNYAFDLFDSLNTTGEPLTAFETFVPIVVQAEGPTHYRTSESYRHMSLTSRLIGQGAGVQQQTERMVTSFLLADGGLKVANNHSSQRKELTRRYKNAKEIDRQRAMTLQMSVSSLCYFRFWKTGELEIDNGQVAGSPIKPTAAFALNFLNKINHNIIIAPLSRYYAAWVASPTEATKIDIENFVLGATAFSVLWRAAHGGTDGIDTVYRKVVSSGIAGYCSPLARTSKSDVSEQVLNELPPVADVLRGLKSLLRTSNTYRFNTCEEWISLSAARPIYEDQFELSKFLLLVSGHYAVPDGSSGLTKDGQFTDNTNLLTRDRYSTDDRIATVEHVAPQNPTPDTWPSDIYSDQTTVNLLGNLTLLPLADNSMISNRSWADKQVFYRALSADAPDESRTILDAAITRGLQLKEGSRDVIVDRRLHLPMLQSIATYEGVWDARFIQSRTEHLLKRAWRVLDSWLEC